MSEATKTTYILQMPSREHFRPTRTDVPGLRVDRVEKPSPAFNKFLHMLVGHPHRWGGRTHWTEKEWADFACDPNVETWIAFYGAAPVGYFELRKEKDGPVAIVCFGLLPEYVGKGIGGPFLSRAIERAWELADTYVWLGTCSHDHPHALENYKARGFFIWETRTEPANAPWPSFWEQVAPT